MSGMSEINDRRRSEMAPAGRSTGSKNKAKGEDNVMDKYMIGGEELWKRGIEKILAEMEEMEEMRNEMREERKEMRREMKKMMDQLAEQRRAREEERSKEREEWLQEKRALEERIRNLEWINEKKERKNRKNKIVIKGVKWRKEISEREVEKCIEDKLKLKVEIKETNRILTREDRSIVIAEINNWEQKKSIISKKKELEKGIIIEDDLTKKERKIQQKLREMARGEREKGTSNVKVGYKKIRMEEKWYRWNEKEERLLEERIRSRAIRIRA